MDFWQDKRVLVFGGRGFIGSHLVGELRRRGARVFSPLRAECDLLVRPQVFDYMEQMKGVVGGSPVFHYCFHLAATVGGIGANRNAPGTFIRDNLLMGVNVIDACLNFRVGQTVVFGTTCMYPKDCPVPFKEADLFNGYPEPTNAPYGIAKRAVMTMLQAYHKQFGMAGTVVIPTNVYGPLDNFDPSTSHVIPAIIKKVHDVKTGVSDHVSVWGTGRPTRDFLYVGDVVDGGLLAAQLVHTPDPVNIGSNKETSIADLVRMVMEISGVDKGVPYMFDHDNPDGQPRRLLDNSKMKLLGWAPVTPLSQGLKATIDWYTGVVNG